MTPVAQAAPTGLSKSSVSRKLKAALSKIEHIIAAAAGEVPGSQAPVQASVAIAEEEGRAAARTDAPERVAPERAAASHTVEHAVDPDAASLAHGAAQTLKHAVRAARRQTC